MADSKISALPASSTPLAGTEVLPIVQSSTTKQVSVANLTAGRAVSALSITSTNDASINGVTVGRGGGALVGNTVIGSLAGNSNTTGTGNFFAGRTAGYSNLSGNYNSFAGGIDAGTVAVGQNNTSGYYNTAFGAAALGSNIAANNNTGVGYQAGYTNTAGQECTFIGGKAGYSTTGGDNTFVGYNSGSGVTTGYANTILGKYSGAGAPISATGNNYVVLSNGSATVAAYSDGTNWYQANNSAVWSITSDERIKKNVVSLKSGLDVISALRPVEFNYIKDDKYDIGFIAQEYQKVLPAQIAEGADGMLSLNQNLVPYLVKAIQELKAEVDSLKQQLGA